MKKQIMLSLCLLLFYNVVAQIELSGSFDGSGSSYSSFHEKETVKIGVPSYNRDHNRDHDRDYFSDRKDREREWIQNEEREKEKRERDRISDGTIRLREQKRREKERREKEQAIILEANKILSNDCVDIQRIQLVIDGFDELEKTSKLSYEGYKARAYLLSQKHNMEPIYKKYSLMATNIREFSFGSINTRMMSLSYEDLDKYLKQFLNEHDFERAKVEYRKFEKAKVLERDIKALHAHSNDKKYLRDNINNVLKLKLVIVQQDALKYVDRYYSFLLDEIEKTIEYDEIKQIPLTVSNIKTVLGPKKATKNNANWKEIAKGMTNQRLLSVLGTLNSENGNVLPNYVKEKTNNYYYYFEGEPIEIDSKIVVKEYIVSKDGSRIEIHETEKSISVAGESREESNMSFMNTDLYEQEKGIVYKILTNGMVNKLGSEVSAGVKAEVSFDYNNDESKASAGIGAEAFHGELSTAVRKAPIMIVHPDNTISFKQESKAVSIGGSLGGKVGVSISSELRIDTPIGSFAVSKGQPNIDGALKQIDSDVVLGIIKSSIDNNYYKSEFNDEAIGKIKNEVEKVLNHNSI